MRIVKLLFFLMCFFVASCGKDQAPIPTDERLDKGHEEWGKVAMVFTQITTKQTQEIVFRNERGTPVPSSTNPIQWKSGERYHLELIYYNNKNERMNEEFLTNDQVKIHQHFFLLGTYDKEKKRFRAINKNTGTDKMSEILTYTYEDTMPESGELGSEGVSYRLRFWDSKNPTATDPVGLKGVFHIQEAASGKFDLKVVLAHFLSESKLKDGAVRRFNELPISAFYASDISLVIPVEIKKSF